MKIGIGITTHNRPEVFEQTLKQIKAFTGCEHKLVIVDDASDVPVEDATYRFEENVGIATAKNKCLELLDDCEHLFIFDDDTYPIVNDWWQPYIESPEPHLMYLFKDFASGRKLGDSVRIYENSKLRAYSHPRGCMLYVDRKVLDVAGGMDIAYGKWGYEHVDWSNRIHNLGLTSFRYADIHSKGMFYSGDEHEAVTTSVERSVRKENLSKMNAKFDASFTSTKYCDYKTIKPYEDRPVILTSYLTSHVDLQRNRKWNSHISDLRDLLDSCADYRVIVLHDEYLDTTNYPNVEFVQIEPGGNPYYQRWLNQYQWLRDNRCETVFMVDATDVTIANTPVVHPGRLYVGDEVFTPSGQPTSLGAKWLRQHCPDPEMVKYFSEHHKYSLLNCGVIGGEYDLALKFVHRMVSEIYKVYSRVGLFDMPIFNYLAYSEFGDKIEHGRKVTTIFKNYEKETSSWFRHK